MAQQVRSLPCGTVTLLFTDIEGSTRLLPECRDRYAGLLADHRRRLRDALTSHEAQRQLPGLPLEGLGLENHEAAVGLLRGALAPDAYETELADGARLAIDEAVDLALAAAGSGRDSTVAHPARAATAFGPET